VKGGTIENKNKRERGRPTTCLYEKVAKKSKTIRREEEAEKK